MENEINLANHKDVFTNKANVIAFERKTEAKTVQTYTATGKPIVKPKTYDLDIRLKVRDLPPKAA